MVCHGADGRRVCYLATMLSYHLVLHGDLPALAGGRDHLTRRLPAPTSAKDAIEAVGIPHVEVGAVTLDDAPAALADRVADGTTLAAWSAEPHDLRDPRFLCDQHLGKLVRLLRFAGFDTAWDPSLREPQLALLASREGRTVVSRHRALLKRNQVNSGLLIRSNHADEQLTEVLRRFRLAGRVAAVGRCTRCNGPLVATAKQDVPVPIPPLTAAWREQYWLCAHCGHLFWEGTHVARLRWRVAAACAGANASPSI